MSEKYFPLTKDGLAKLAERYPTPFYLYDEKAMRDHARRFFKAFSRFPNFREFFAVKACPNPYILKILASEGIGADCSSLPELILSEKAGITGEGIMFSSNETPSSEYQAAHKKGAIINLDDITHIDYLEKALGAFPDLISFRYNPGPLREGNALIGKPEEAKYGLTREQIFEAYAKARDKGAKRFALHTMVASNELNPDYFVETARMLFELCAELKSRLGIRVEFVDLGGGIGIPYRPGQKAVDYDYVAAGIEKAYKELIAPAGLDPLGISFECGRPFTGPYGWLVTKAIHEKHIYREYIGVDASMADLMRPGMYGAWHHVSVAGKENAPPDENVRRGRISLRKLRQVRRAARASRNRHRRLRDRTRRGCARPRDGFQLQREAPRGRTPPPRGRQCGRNPPARDHRRLFRHSRFLESRLIQINKKRLENCGDRAILSP